MISLFDGFVQIGAETIWITIGLGAQFLFGMRFIVQWLHSERAGKSIIPLSFWYLSVLGGCAMLAYSIYRKDIVFILGQSMGLVVYLRNLWLLHRTDRGSLH